VRRSKGVALQKSLNKHHTYRRTPNMLLGEVDNRAACRTEEKSNRFLFLYNIQRRAGADTKDRTERKSGLLIRLAAQGK